MFEYVPRSLEDDLYKLEKHESCKNKQTRDSFISVFINSAIVHVYNWLHVNNFNACYVGRQPIQ